MLRVIVVLCFLFNKLCCNSYSLPRFDFKLGSHVVSFETTNPKSTSLLERYRVMLVSANQKINLVSRRDIGNIKDRHILPCAKLATFVSPKAHESVVDVGSGGGLPGIPLAIMYPDVSVTLIDSCSKKVDFLRSVVKELSLSNVEVMCCRAESCSRMFDIIVGRSVANIGTLLQNIRHLVVDDDRLRNGLYYIKGGDLDAEFLRWRVANYSCYDLGMDWDLSKKVIFISSKYITNWK